jgi:spore coat protein H
LAAAAARILRNSLCVRRLMLIVLAAGCGGGENDWEAAAPMFEPDRVLEVAIQIDPADWELLRNQTRTPQDLFERPDCLGSPFPNPFTWFAASVTIDGVVLDGVEVRKKGFIGSLDANKPSLKVALDHADPSRRHQGLEMITLNNSVQDPSYINQCVAYALFTRAGRPAPRCNFAQVSVNGQSLGLYVHVESIEDELIDHFFGDSDGNLYEGTLSDFLPAWSGTFEKKNNQAEADWSDLQAVITAAQAPDPELLTALEAVIDLEELIEFWALESLIRHWDGYAGNINNFWLYHASDDRLHFLPWGSDQVLVDHNPIQGEDAPTSVYATGYLAWRLYRHPEGKMRYAAAMRALLAEVWDETWLLAEVDRMQALIRPLVQNPELDPILDLRREFIRNRRDAVLADLEAPWPYDLRPPLCQ